MAWLTGWSYRKSITLSRASGAVTNYQMKLLVGESSGATGEDVDCGAKCQTDFDDIRFTNLAGTVLDYWIESISGATPNQLATIWIEFDSIDTTDTTFYMYYGNIAASAYSNGDNTFLFFDDFPGVSIDGTKWSGDTGKVTVSSSIATLTNTVAGDGKIYTATQSGNIAMRTKLKFSAVAYCQLFFHEDWAADLNFIVWHYDDATPWNILTAKAGVGTSIGTTSGSTASYSIYDFCRQLSTDTVAIYKDDSQIGTNTTTNVPTVALNTTLRAYKVATNLSIYADWVLIRQWLVTGPAYGSWGTEGTLGAATASDTTLDEYRAKLDGVLTALSEGTVDSYGFEYGLTTSYGSTATVNGNIVAGDTFDRVISGLSANTLYHYRAFVHTEYGYFYSADGDFTTYTEGISIPTTLDEAQKAASRTPYIYLVFFTSDGSSAYDFSSDSATYPSRILMIDHIEEPYNGYAYIMLRNNDLLVPNLVGCHVYIGYGDYVAGVGQFVQKPLMWVKEQRLVSGGGKLYVLLVLEDVWSLFREQLVLIGNPPYYNGIGTSELDSLVSGQTIIDIVSNIVSEINTATGLDLQVSYNYTSDGIIDVYQPNMEYTSVVGSQVNNASTLIQQLMGFTVSFLRVRYDRILEVVYPQLTDPIRRTYYNTQPHYFYEYQNIDSLKIPNRILVIMGQNDDGTWPDKSTIEASMGEAKDEVEIDRYMEVTDIHVAGYIQSQTDAQARADALLVKVGYQQIYGKLVIPHDAALELFDNIGIVEL